MHLCQEYRVGNGRAIGNLDAGEAVWDLDARKTVFDVTGGYKRSSLGIIAERQDSAAGDIQSARRAVKDGVARQQQSLVRRVFEATSGV
jgi:hypothetical protein